MFAYSFWLTTMVDFFYGVIEGFYGRQWSWQVRSEYASFLRQFGFNCYIYAPKGDSYFRSQWRLPHPEAEWHNLQQLAAHYRAQGLRWGIGLSPLGLSQHYSSADKHLLAEKVEQINQLSPDILCILFDDVRGDIDGLAERQLEIVEDIVAVSSAGQHIVCPTYYSFDPVLEEVFGAMPAGYLEKLGAGLAEDIGVFWTGNHVIAESYTQMDLDRAAGLLKRRPVIWDNYPVNDGRLTSEHLHLLPYSGRPQALPEWSAGHVVNPMNQPTLSQFVLRSLFDLYGSAEGYDLDGALNRGLSWLNDEGLAKSLAGDIDVFQAQGLSSLNELERSRLLNKYASFNHPVAEEIVDWLSGGYQFDPACLTG